MVELYITDKKVDISNDIDISLTYEMNDLADPQAVKNNYSKTVTLEGTPNNNKIFGDIYRFDKEILDNESLIGANFNPNKRVDYYIVNNGDVIDSGYFQLDEISYSNNRIQYNITLFGGIGDFFYNLMYANEEEEERTLGSLYYGIDGMTKEDEERKNLFEYDKDFVLECWNKRMNNEVDKSLHSIFCPIPTHSGNYDDFDSDTILTNETKDIPDRIVEDGKTYSWFPNSQFKKIKAERSLSEWEIGDLRSHYQRLGIRLEEVYNAIKNPINNGGYEVDDSQLDEHSKNYIKDGYIMLNRFDYETINETNTSINLTFSAQPLSSPLNSIGKSVSNTFDVSEFVNPHVTASIVPEIKCNGARNGDIATTIFSYGPVLLEQRVINPFSNIVQRTYGYMCFGSMQLYYLRMLDENNNSIGITKPIVYGSYYNDPNDYIIGWSNRRGDIEYRLLEEASKYFPEYGYNPDKLGWELNYKYYNMNGNQVMYAKNTSLQANVGKDFVGYEQIEIESSLPKECKKIRLESVTVATKYILDVKDENKYYNFSDFETTKQYDYWNIDFPVVALYNEGNAPNSQKYYGYDISGIFHSNEKKMDKLVSDYVVTYNADGYINNTEENITQIYDGSVSVDTKRHVLNKKQIFSETKTPFDYLISMGKLFNWVFEKDAITKTIRIYSKYNYYDKNIIDISDKIDRKEFTVIPTTLEYNKYIFNLPLPDTYSTELFKKKNNRIYSQFIYKPNYQFNSESKEVLEDSSFTLSMPYLMHSVFLTDTAQYPVITMGSEYTVTYYGSDTTESIDKTYRGLLTSNVKIVTETNDVSEKLCCFDKDNEGVTDLSDVLVLYNGKTSVNKKKIFISNDVPIINQINGNNCYMMTNGNPIWTSTTTTDREYVQTRIYEYPSFLNHNENYSLLFNETERENDLWSLFFKNDVTNIYNRNAKVVTIKYNLTEKPQNALKHFYYFDNSIWILNKINDYNPNSYDFTEVEFIKITDYSTYCKPIIK